MNTYYMYIDILIYLSFISCFLALVFFFMMICTFLCHVKQTLSPWHLFCDHIKVLEKNRKTIEKNVTPVLVLTYHYNMSSITRIANKGESFRKPLLS